MKLEYYGFRGKFLEFLMSFIKDRAYFVNVNGRNSEIKTVNKGVPQGSTLGPLFFLLYINDMVNCSDEKDMDLSQFADDSTMSITSKTLKLALDITERELKKILEWLAVNKLIINLDKTNLMVFTHKRRTGTVSINAYGHTINEITETTYLGVVIDNKLTWNAHIKHITNKISKSVSLLKMLKHTFPCRILKSLYYSFVYPYFSYCNLIWGGAAKTHLESLILLQKKCVRIISKVGYYDHTAPLFSKLELLTVEQIYDLNCAKFTFCSLNNIKYSEFSNRLATNGSFHNYPTRSGRNLRKPYVRLQKFMNSFINNGIEIWNSLPAHIKNRTTLPSFKNRAKEFILKKCTLCRLKEIGDQYHYLLVCPKFEIPRMEHIRKDHYSQPNKNKLTQLLQGQNYKEMIHLQRFMQIIRKKIKLFDPFING